MDELVGMDIIRDPFFVELFGKANFRDPFIVELIMKAIIREPIIELVDKAIGYIL